MPRSLMALALALPLLFGACTATTADNTPYPQEYGNHFASQMSDRVSNIYHTSNYVLLNTNADQPPYDTHGETLGRDLATIHRTIDTHLFLNDWNDPYVD